MDFRCYFAVEMVKRILFLAETNQISIPSPYLCGFKKNGIGKY